MRFGSGKIAKIAIGRAYRDPPRFSSDMGSLDILRRRNRERLRIMNDVNYAGKFRDDVFRGNWQYLKSARKEDEKTSFTKAENEAVDAISRFIIGRPNEESRLEVEAKMFMGRLTDEDPYGEYFPGALRIIKEGKDLANEWRYAA